MLTQTKAAVAMEAVETLDADLAMEVMAGMMAKV